MPSGVHPTVSHHQALGAVGLGHLHLGEGREGEGREGEGRRGEGRGGEGETPDTERSGEGTHVQCMLACADGLGTHVSEYYKETPT